MRAESPFASPDRSRLSQADAEYRSLMVRYQAGDREAFEALYLRLAPDLGAYLDSLGTRSARDSQVIEAIFLQIHQARRSYDPGQPFEPWVMAIARHVALARNGRGSGRTLIEVLRSRFAPGRC
jgi:RNA polymerase sigma-70 factor (ECF subfamily)